MESSSFQTQMLSIMEVLAQAAAAEIHRRVDDSCALLRLEVSQSRRDIDSLKRKCEVMEAELRRSRLRVRSKGLSPPAAAPVSLTQENQDQAWTALIHVLDQPEQSEVQEPLQVPAVVQVKEEEEEWQYEDSLEFRSQASVCSPAPVEDSHQLPFDPKSVVSPTEIHDLHSEPVVKQEQVEAPDRTEALALPWSSKQSGELDFSQQIPPSLASQKDSTFQNPSATMAAQTWTHQNERDTASSKDQRQLGHSGHTSQSPATNPQALSGYSRSRRTRTPWRSCPGERQYGCTYCDKSFLWFNHLKEHVRSHTGEKPYSCQQCGRRFTKQYNLMRHAVVHSGEKPFQCSFCGKCFTQRSGLKLHQKNAH